MDSPEILSNYLVGQIGYITETQDGSDSTRKARKLALAEVNRVLELLIHLDEVMCNMALKSGDGTIIPSLDLRKMVENKFHESHWHTIIKNKVDELRAIKAELEELLTPKTEANG